MTTKHEEETERSYQDLRASGGIFPPLVANKKKVVELLTERNEGKIYFVMTGLPSPDGEFVELEDSGGQGLGLGRWVKLGEGRYALEIDDPRGGLNASIDLADPERDLVVLALERVARAKAVTVHSRTDVEAAKVLLAKFGFPFSEGV